MANRQLRIAVVFCAVAAVLVFFVAFFVSDHASDDDITVSQNPAIEAIFPERSDEVFQQEKITLDLAAGFEGLIIRINDIEIPANQVTFDSSRNIVGFAPGAGKVLATLLPEQNCVEARYWRSADGPTLAKTFHWCFTAS
ncbi:MAG: hypothetical protein ACKVKO_02480 [Acidimicrobiales bacterium]